MNLLKELSEWRQEYVELFGGDERYKYLKKSLLVYHMSMVPTLTPFHLYFAFLHLTLFTIHLYLHAGTDKWTTIPNMGYVIANRYNVIFVSLSEIQSLTIFPLRTQAPSNFSHY